MGRAWVTPLVGRVVVLILVGGFVRGSGALAPTLTDATSPSTGAGLLASYGLPFDGEGSGAKLDTASPRCAIASTASDPTLRTVQGGTAGRSCEGGQRSPSFRLSPPAFMVRRDSTRSRSFVLAALRALHLDGVFAAGRSAPLSGKARDALGWLRLGHPAGGVRPGRLVTMPQADTEVDQRAAEFDAAFPADAAVAAATGGFVLHRGQPGRPVQL